MDRTHHPHRSRPPDVEEALSSMLWTPYDCNASPSDVQTSSDDDEEQNNQLQQQQQHQLNKKPETNNNRVSSLATISPYVPFRKCDPKLIAAPLWGQKLLQPPSYESLYCTTASRTTTGDRLSVRTDRLPVISSLKSLNNNSNNNNNNYGGNISVTNTTGWLSSFTPRATVAPRQEPKNLNRMVYSFSDNFITTSGSQVCRYI